jgi:hypothetical protein
MFHTHHIIPKYKGGTDEKSNLVKVTVTQHAMFHYCNWKLWGNKEDWLAWRGLTGEIGKEEMVHKLRMIASEKGVKAMLEKQKFLYENDPEFLERARQHALQILPKAREAALSEGSREKRIDSFKRIQHQKGETNSQYGTMWITNGETNKKIKKNEPIPEGYFPGRKLK